MRQSIVAEAAAWRPLGHLGACAGLFSKFAGPDSGGQSAAHLAVIVRSRGTTTKKDEDFSSCLRVSALEKILMA